MVGWHHRLNGYGFGWTPGVADGQGGLVCCSPWGCKESDTTERLNLTELRLANYFAGSPTQTCLYLGLLARKETVDRKLNDNKVG